MKKTSKTQIPTETSETTVREIIQFLQKYKKSTKLEDIPLYEFLSQQGAKNVHKKK